MADSEKTQFVGASIPDGLFQSVNLYSIAKDIPKTQIIRRSISIWAGHENIDIAVLIDEIKIKCQNEWLRKKTTEWDDKTNDQIFEDHITQWHDHLRAKHISEKIIEKILDQIEQ